MDISVETIEKPAKTWFTYGPGELVVEATNKGKELDNKGKTNDSTSQFKLDDGNWVALQVWAADVNLLPTNRSLMKDQLDPSHSIDYPEDEFDDLIGLYEKMQKTVADFTGYTDENGNYVNGAYDVVIDTAQMIVNHSHFIQTYYAGVHDEIKRFVDQIQSASGDIAALKTRLLRRLSRIKEKADEAHERADEAHDRTVSIHTQVSSQKDELEKIETEYKSKYAIKDKQLANLWADIAEKQAQIQDDNARYARDVGLAAGVGSAAFFFVMGGWIAGPVIAGIFGHDATKAQEKLREHEEELQRITVKYQFQWMLHLVLGNSRRKMDDLHEDLVDAKEVLGKLRDVWKALSGDVQALYNDVNMTELDAKEAPDMLISLSESDPGDLELVLQDWQRVGGEAQNFVANAHVTFSK